MKFHLHATRQRLPEFTELHYSQKNELKPLAQAEEHPPRVFEDWVKAHHEAARLTEAGIWKFWVVDSETGLPVNQAPAVVAEPAPVPTEPVPSPATV